MVNFGPLPAEKREMAAQAHALREGDDVVAGSDAVAELEHFDGSLTRLDTGATAALRRIADPTGQAHVILDLGPGASWHRTSPTRVRGGQYEARTPTASALARAAVFVVRRDVDGGAWFAVLRGTVVVRGHAGGMVVLRAGESVHAAAEGSLGSVSDAGVDTLAHDEWVAVNQLLDAEAAGTPDVAVGEGEFGPEGVSEADIDVDVDVDEGREREHPWRVGVAAGLALGLAVFSVVIGRAGTKQPAEPTAEDPAIAVPGPPAFATPAVTAPNATSAPAPVAEKPPAAVPTAEVTGKTCTRSRGVVVYNGSLHNHAAGTASFRVHVSFITADGAVVTTATTTVADVPADATRSFKASAAAGSTAAACEVDRVEPV